MIFACAIGVLSCIVVLIAMARIDLQKFMGYPAIMDVAVTLLLMWMLHGSYVGMVAAVIGGLVFSLAITVIRRCYGYKRLTWRGWVTHPAPLNRNVLNNININNITKIPLKYVLVVMGVLYII